MLPPVPTDPDANELDSNSDRSRIALVGMPGSGKTTIGRQLAKRLGWALADADSVAERRIGMPIRLFFEQHGEEAFRDLEAALIDELSQQPRTVLSTGGGAVLRAANRERMRSKCHVVYLHSTPEELFRRLRNDSVRPLLQVDDPLARLRDLFAKRDVLYRQAAHFVVDTGRASMASLVNMILMQLELAGAIDPSIAPSPVVPIKDSQG